MKNIYLIAIVFVAFCSIIKAKDSNDFDIKVTYKKCSNKIPTECPEIDPPNATIHIAHETDCEKFYRCLAGEKILEICPPRNDKGDRLHFNKRCQVCDWPATAKCHHHTTPYSGSSNYCKSTLKLPEDWEDCSDKDDGALMPHKCNCKLYYSCKDSEKIQLKCPKDTYFSRHYKGCVPKADSDCS